MKSDHELRQSSKETPGRRCGVVELIGDNYARFASRAKMSTWRLVSDPNLYNIWWRDSSCWWRGIELLDCVSLRKRLRKICVLRFMSWVCLKVLADNCFIHINVLLSCGSSQETAYSESEKLLMGHRKNCLLGIRRNRLLGIRRNRLLGIRRNRLWGIRRNRLLAIRRNRLLGIRRNRLLAIKRNRLLGIRRNRLLGIRSSSSLGRQQTQVAPENRNVFNYDALKYSYWEFTGPFQKIIWTLNDCVGYRYVSDNFYRMMNLNLMFFCNLKSSFLVIILSE